MPLEWKISVLPKILVVMMSWWNILLTFLTWSKLSDTRLNIKEAVSFGLIRKKGRYLQHHISTKSTIWKKHQTRLVPSKLQLIVALWKIFQNHWNGVMRRRFQQQNYTSKLYLYCALFTHSRWLSILRVRIALWSTFHYNILRSTFLGRVRTIFSYFLFNLPEE